MNWARPLAIVASNPVSNSFCRSGRSVGSPARVPMDVPELPPMVPVVSGEKMAPNAARLPVCPYGARNLNSSTPPNGRSKR